MVKASGVSTSSAHRIWRAFSLQPHCTETFKLSSDPLFVEKVRDIVGLYLNPPLAFPTVSLPHSARSPQCFKTSIRQAI